MSCTLVTCFHQSVLTIILRLKKVVFFECINVTNILFIGFVKFETKQDQFCVWFSLALLPTENARAVMMTSIVRLSCNRS